MNLTVSNMIQIILMFISWLVDCCTKMKLSDRDEYFMKWIHRNAGKFHEKSQFF